MRVRRHPPGGGWSLVAAAMLAALGAAAAEPPAVQALRIDGARSPHIDGLLDEPVWQEAGWFSDFRQSVPDLGEPAQEPTRVAFLLDEHNLFVGVRCNDSRPDLIRANKLRHRDDPDTDDHIELILDTYRDQIRGTVFVVNPLGAKEEGLVNGYEKYTWNWNEVWEVRTRVTDAGWQAEIRIPLRLLHYGSAPEQVWGVNVKRVVRRLQEESYLAAPPPPYDISSLNFAGELRDLELGERQRNLQLIPYGLAGVLREDAGDGLGETDESVTEVGLDLKYAVTTDLTLNATVNTDFSQVEADDLQVNLTRFSLFYPEKREFFLENAELFSFGHGGGFGGRPPEVTPFFSRRIGIFQGETVPIDGGLRLTGKVGRSDLGLLSVRTGGVDELGLEPVWYNVARLRTDLGGRSYVGGILTDARIDGERSTTYGLDGTWYLSQDLSFLVDGMRVEDSRSGEPTSAVYAGLDLTTDPWGFLFSYREIGEGFAPAVGFVRREGFRSGSGSLRRSVRPGRWGVRRISLRVFGDAYESLAYDMTESSALSLMSEIELENGDFLGVGVRRSFERLFEPFELDDDLVFASGDYSFSEWWVEYESDESRRWGFELGLGKGGFFDGDTTQGEAELWFVLSRHIRAAGSYELYDVSSDHGAVDWRLWGLRLEYIVSSNLSASAFLQHDSSSASTILNLRLRWILHNDSDLYLVYNDSELELEGAEPARGRELALKLSYRFFL